MYLFVCFFCLIPKLLKFTCSTVRDSYMLHMLNYLCIHNIYDVLKYAENENLKPYYFSQHHKHLIIYF